jgi:hypothetical protein
LNQDLVPIEHVLDDVIPFDGAVTVPGLRTKFADAQNDIYPASIEVYYFDISDIDI